MTFITADQMARRFPGTKVILLSHYEAMLPESEKAKYKMTFIRFPRKMQRLMLRLGIRNEYTEIFRNAVAMLDISGYRLGSNWGVSSVKGYLQKIEMARHFGIPVYLMPQSFGPFDFHGFKSWGLMSRIRKTLSYADVIMAREEKSYRLLKDNFGLDNVVLTPDLVLQSKGINPENIFVNPPEMLEIDMPEGTVAIIPNSRNSEYGRLDEIMDLYSRIIARLRAEGRAVCLLAHANEDLELCRKIKQNAAPTDDKVILVEQDLNCFELSKLVRKFDFIVASRFHSIVHAYREKVPALILGWADKYRELSMNLNQGQFFYDVRDELNVDKILQSLDYLIMHHKDESQKIAAKLEALQADCVYDCIKIKQ